MKPVAGLVLHYDYLWKHEFERGAENASKGRPCAVIVATVNHAGIPQMVVAPITHSEPDDPAHAIEIPAAVKAHLGLDTDRSWIITDDLNVCALPSPDLLPVPNGPRTGEPAYGMLPPKLFEQVKTRILAHPPRPTPRTT